MKLSYGKKTIAAIILTSFLAGSIPAYASTLLDTETIDKIKSYIVNLIPGLYSDINSKNASVMDQNRKKIGDYIDLSTGRVIGNLTEYTDDEKARLEDELNAYTDELLSKLDQVMDEQSDGIKDDIHSYTDQVIDSSKDQLEKELTIQLQEHLNK